MATPQFVPFPNVETANASAPFSPVDGEAPLRWQRAVHLAPRDGLGVARRAIFFALVAWLPIAFWALIRGRFIQAAAGEPLLQHYGVHVRCLVAIPLLILGEATLHKAALRYFPQFISSGLVDDATRPAFEAVLRSVRRWREIVATLDAHDWRRAGLDASSILPPATATRCRGRSTRRADSVSAAYGLSYVVRPLFVALLLGWLWRLALLVVFFARLGTLSLSFVPSHPDRLGGLGFLEKLPTAFAPVSLALSATIASRWAHEIVYHQQSITALKLPAAMFVVVWVAAAARAIRAVDAGAACGKTGGLARTTRPWSPSRGGSYAAVDRRHHEGRRSAARAGRRGRDRRRRDDVRRGAVDAYSSDRQGVTRRRGRTLATPMFVVAALQIPIRTLLLGLLKTLI
jgi:hypothetical protein